MIEVKITAPTADKLAKLVGQLATQLGASMSLPAIEPATPAIEGAGENPVAVVAEVTAEKPAEKPTEEPAEEPDKVANEVGEKTPAEARDEGIRLMQTWFANNPNGMPEITKMMQKFAVKMFSDIEDSRAHEFLADVHLLTGGAATA